MKKLLWLLLLPAVLSGWIMTPNPGLDLWTGANGDTLRFAQYFSLTNNAHKTTGVEGYAVRVVRKAGTSTASTPIFQCPIDVTPTGYSDTIVVWLKGSSANENSVAKLRLFTPYYQLKDYLNIDARNPNWVRYTFPYSFTKGGHYRFYIYLPNTPSSHDDTIIVDSAYIKRVVYDSHLYTRGRKNTFILSAEAYFIHRYWVNGVPESTHKLGLQGMRISDAFSSFIDTMDVPTDLWVADYTIWDSTLKLLYEAGINNLMLRFIMHDLDTAGMRYSTIDSLTLPLTEDGSFYLSHILYHTDSILDDWGIDNIKYIGLLNEDLIEHVYVTSKDIDTFFARFSVWAETCRVYFPDAEIGHPSTILWKVADSASVVGISIPEEYKTSMYHYYGWSNYTYPNEDWEILGRSVVYRINGIDYYSSDNFDFSIYSEYLASITQSTENTPAHWVIMPGLLGRTHVDYLNIDTWVVPNFLIRLQYNDTLTALWYSQYFISQYQGRKSYYSQSQYSPAFYVKIEPETYIIANPLQYDTIQVQLPKAGIAKVRWLDPNTQFPILRTENRSPIYEKTMCVGNRLTIPPGYMYAIEYLR